MITTWTSKLFYNCSTCQNVEEITFGCCFRSVLLVGYSLHKKLVGHLKVAVCQ